MPHRPQPGNCPARQRPLLARRPLLGLLVAAAGGLLFTVLAVQVRRRGRLSEWDEAACQSMHRRAVLHARPWLALMLFGAALGRELALLITLALGLYWLIRRRWRPLAMLLVGVIGGNTWFVVLSRFFKRQRPVFSDPIHTISGPGFPSGHSLTSVTLYGLIFYLLLPGLRFWRWRWLAAVDASLVVFVVGFSRFYLGDHYVTDVLGGYGFGIFWGALSYTIIEWISSRMAL